MGFDTPARPVIHRRHFDLGRLQGTEAALDDHKALVAAGGVFQTDGVVVGLDDPLAVVLFRLTDGTAVDTHLPGLEDTKVALEPA